MKTSINLLRKVTGLPYKTLTKLLEVDRRFRRSAKTKNSSITLCGEGTSDWLVKNLVVCQSIGPAVATAQRQARGERLASGYGRFADFFCSEALVVACAGSSESPLAVLP